VPGRPPPFARTHRAKRPFEIDTVLELVDEAVRPYPKAALFELAERGFSSPFEVLVACIISIRTRDETTVAVAPRLLSRARTPAAMRSLDPAAIDALITPCTFHQPKARQIHQIATRVADEFGGNIPCDFDTLTAFRGVGPKCANLTLGIACGQPTGIGVDVHVHRVTNRWGYIAARTPEQTMASLQEKLPARHRVRLNALLVPFGKHICTGVRPRCSACPVLAYCRQVGVENPR
jgi:endonuclease-3